MVVESRNLTQHSGVVPLVADPRASEGETIHVGAPRNYRPSAAIKYFRPEELPDYPPGLFIGEEGEIIDETLYRNVTVTDFEGDRYLVSSKAILTVNLTEICNASCQFCFNGITFFPFQPAARASLLERLKRVLDFSRKAGIRSVSFSGGEPTLAPELLLAALKEARAIFPGFIRLHTNGSRLWRGHEGTSRLPLIDLLEFHGLSDLSISRVASDPGINDALMKMPVGSSLSETQLLELATRFPGMRLSCFFSPGAVSNGDEMLRYLEWGLSCGVRRFAFRLASGIDGAYSIPGVFYDGNHGFRGPDTSDLAELLLREGFSIDFRRQCEDYDLFVLKRDDLEVSVDRSSDVPDPDRKVRRLVFMPNGICYTSWVQGGATLFPNDDLTLIEQAKNGLVGSGGKFPAAAARQPYFRRSGERAVDLHLHSTVSDGLLSCSEVIERLVSAGISKAVFTEHNALHDAIPALRDHARERGLNIPTIAVEASTVYRSRLRNDGFKFHLLMFGPGLQSEEMQAWLGQALYARRRHIEDAYAHMAADGVRLAPLEELYVALDPIAALHSRKKMFTRGPLARAAAAVTGLSEAEVKGRWIPRFQGPPDGGDGLDIWQALERARQFGLCSILAHPGWVRPLPDTENPTFDGVLRAIIELSLAGLDGIEVRHRINSAEQREQLLGLARMTDLLVTGGSDYHGKPRCEIGVDGSTEEELERILDRISRKVNHVAASSLR